MKKLTVCALALIMIMSLAGCGSKQISQPEHKISGIYAQAPDNSGILGAYITATDLAINQVIDTKRKSMPEFISFNFNTNVPLQPSQKEALLKAFEVYGIPIDTDGHKAQTVERMSKGLVIAYQDSADLNSSGSDLTVQVEVITNNYGYIYCSDFDVKGGEYILTGYDDSTVVPYI